MYGGNADKVLWERREQDIKSRLQWAQANSKPEVAEGDRANAFYILYQYYNHGWGGLRQNRARAHSYLECAAALGHSRACYDFVTQDTDNNKCIEYLNIAIRKIDDSKFNCPVAAHNQKSMEHELRRLQLLLNRKQAGQSSSPTFTLLRDSKHSSQTSNISAGQPEFTAGRQTEDELRGLLHSSLP